MQNINIKTENSDTKALFISYGRRESLAFAARLHKLIRANGDDAWFDKVNIPHADNYQQRINNGIESAHNFLFVIAPHSIRSKFCLLEVTHAIIMGKRIIPLLHVMPDNDDWNFASEAEKANGNDQLADQLQQSIYHIQSIDWIYAREELGDISALQKWRDSYENTWKNHEDDEYLRGWDCPIKWDVIDDLEIAFRKVNNIIIRQFKYVNKHTSLVQKALIWKNNQKATRYLLTGRERAEAEQWLTTDFIPPKQPPCLPTALQCEFICASKKNAENLMTDVFICCADDDIIIRDQVIEALSKYCVTVWVEDKDVVKGSDLDLAINEGIEKADNILYFISPGSAKSKTCQDALAYAIKNEKRIIPLLIEETKEEEMPKAIKGLQNVDFTDNIKLEDFDKDIDDIINIINYDKVYFYEHKTLLTRALKWEKESRMQSLLLRGFDLEAAQAWLRVNKSRKTYLPTDLHRSFIAASEEAKGFLRTEIFISYSQKDGDFARKLNDGLQHTGKTTWFDQESIPSGADFEKEVFKGIASSDNFLFIVSPDAINSQNCVDELEYAKSLNKKIVVAFCRETEAELLPPAIGTGEKVDFIDTPYFDAFNELIQVIEIDRDYARKHTEVQERATEWLQHDYSEDFLLNITAFNNAQLWINEAGIDVDSFYTNKQKDPPIDPETKIISSRVRLALKKCEKKPKPTTLQLQFILFSKEAIIVEKKKEAEIQNSLKRRLRLAWIALSISVLLLGVSGVATYLAIEAKKEAVIQKQNAEEATKEAEAQRLIAETEKEQANKERKKAVEAQKFAEAQRLLAIEQSEIAEREKLKAENEKIIADDARRKAVKSKRDADLSAAIAKLEKEKAEKQRKLAQLQKAKADSLKKIEYAKSLALLAEKVASSNKEQARQYVLQAYDSLITVTGKVDNPILFSALTSVYESYYPDKVNILQNKKELVHFQIVKDKIYSVSENGEMFINDLSTNTVYSLAHNALLNLQSFYIQKNEIIIGDRFGNLSLYKIVLKDNIYTIEESFKAQVHEKNTSISNIRTLKINNSVYWVTTGYDGTLRINSIANNKFNPVFVDSVSNSKAISLDIHPENKSLIVGFSNKLVRFYEVVNNAPDQMKKTEFTNDNIVTSFKYIDGNNHILLGFEDGVILKWDSKTQITFLVEIEKEHAKAITYLGKNKNYVVSCARDQTVKLRRWSESVYFNISDVAFTYLGHKNAKGDIKAQIIDDGKYVISIDGENIHKWMTQPEDLYNALKEEITTSK